MEKLCLDTNIIVDVLRNKKEGIAFVTEHESIYDFCITSITLYELLYGALKSINSEKNVEKTKSLIEGLEILEFTKECAEKAAKVQVHLEKQGKSIEIRDLFIAAIALSNNIKLKTNNKKHFSDINELELIQ